MQVFSDEKVIDGSVDPEVMRKVGHAFTWLNGSLKLGALIECRLTATAPRVGVPAPGLFFFLPYLVPKIVPLSL